MSNHFAKSKLTKLTAILLAVMLIVSTVPAEYSFAAADSSGVDLEWYNFRNNPENNGVTGRTTPTSIDETAMKWASKYGSGYSASPTPPLLLNGNVYIGCGRKVLELEKETGKLLRESDDMVADVGYAMNPILYADGKLFVQVGNGIVQAIDLATMKTLWHTTKVGGQTVSPISYVKIDGTGYIYTGTWTGEKLDGRFMCFTTDDKNVQNGVKAAQWQFMPGGSKPGTEPQLKYDPDLYAKLSVEGSNAQRGFYWAGAYANENYIAVGSDDGAAEGDYQASAVFYTLNPKTGDIIDKIDGITGDIRTSAVYNNGYLYFSTKGGHLYKVSVDAEGHLGEPSYIDLGGMTTAAPPVHKNKIYIGVAGPGGQFDADAGHSFAVVDNSTETLNQDSLLYSLPIKGYPQASALLSTAYENEDFDGDGTADGRVYIYFTYNALPGGIYYTYDTPSQKEAAKTSAELFIPEKDKQQYCISTICADYEGTLYYKNDAGCLMAVETNPAYIQDVTVTADDGSGIIWDQKYSSRITSYNLKAKDTAKSVKFKITPAPGATAEINGKLVGDPTTVELNGSEAQQVQIVAKKDGKQRIYNFCLRTTAEITTLDALKVSTSNTYNLNLIPLLPEFTSDVLNYDVDVADINGFYRIWPEATDKNSIVTVTAGKNVASKTGGTSIEGQELAKKTGGGRPYYAVYLEDTGADAEITVKVTSENGKKAETYQLRLIRNRVDVSGITLSEDTKTLAKGSSFELTADVQPENATYKNVIWSTTDGNVAKVDSEGNVTAVGEGTASIGAMTVSGSFSAVCEVTVIDLEQEADTAKSELNSYKDKNNYRAAEQAEIDRILEKAGIEIDQATSKEELEKIVADAKAELDQVKTDAQYIDEEVKLIEGVETTTISASTALGANSIKVSWKKAPGYKVDYYEIYRSTSKTFNTKNTYTAKSTSLTNSTDLTDGKYYYYKVRGVRTIDGKAYYTKWSNIAYRKYSKANAKIIAGVENTKITTASRLGANSIRLSWSKSGSYKVDYYEIYRSTSKDFAAKNTYTAKSTSLTNSKNLTDGKYYYYKVRGVRTVDGVKHYTPWSNIAGRKYSKANAKIIAGVENTKITATSKAYKGYMKLTWKKSGSYKVDSYQVYRSTSKTFKTKNTYTVKSTTLKNSKNLKKGKRYYYKVRGVRTVNGVKYYTKWSNITYKTAK